MDRIFQEYGTLQAWSQASRRSRPPLRQLETREEAMDSGELEPEEHFGDEWVRIPIPHFPGAELRFRILEEGDLELVLWNVQEDDVEHASWWAQGYIDRYLESFASFDDDEGSDEDEEDYDEEFSSTEVPLRLDS